MCEFCDKIRRAKANSIMYDLDHFADTYLRNDSRTSRIFTTEDLIEMGTYSNAKFCPKCGNKI